MSLPKPLLDAVDKQAEVEIRNRSELIREALRAYLLKKGADSPDTFSGSEQDRIKYLSGFNVFKDQTLFLISCSFRPQPNVISKLFAGVDSPVVKLLENPHRFRSYGWDLQTLDRAKPIAGEFLEVNSGNRKIVRVYRDGQAVFAGDEDFTGYGTNRDHPKEDTPFLFNGLGVAELITNFTYFAHELGALIEEKPTKIIFKVEVLNPQRKNLGVAMVHRKSSWADQHGEIITLDMAAREVVVNLAEKTSYEQSAYKVLAEFFYFFGLTEDQFWYVDKDKKVVNTEFFKDK